MESNTQIFLCLTGYKIITLLVGSFFSYMGYRLFKLGIWGKAGNLEANIGDKKLILKRAAPGTFFALFGAIIISLTVIKGLELNDYSNIANPLVQKYHKNMEDTNELPEDISL